MIEREISDKELNDEWLICADCQNKFIFTIGEQIFFRDKALEPPKRCLDCRKQKRNNYFRRVSENECCTRSKE